MYSSNILPWTQMNDFLIEVGSVRQPKEFCVQMVQNIYSLIPYDQARIYLVDEVEGVYDEVLINVEKQWSDAYLKYYSKINNGRFGILNSQWEIWPEVAQILSVSSEFIGGVYDWTEHPANNEFITEYIKPQRLKYSASFVFYSANNIVKSFCILDRTARCGYSEHEIEMMRRIQPNLANLHKNLFVFTSKGLTIQDTKIKNMLTSRELEISDLLCKGLTPAQISKKLSVCQSTVYRHIANIHAKLNVSNRQELILKLLRSAN